MLRNVVLWAALGLLPCASPKFHYSKKASSSSVAPAKPKKNRPNIALVIVDDLAMDAMGAYRAVEGPVKAPKTLGLHTLFKHIPTPAIDTMAKEGVMFTRA